MSLRYALKYEIYIYIFQSEECSFRAIQYTKQNRTLFPVYLHRVTLTVQNNPCTVSIRTELIQHARISKSYHWDRPCFYHSGILFKVVF